MVTDPSVSRAQETNYDFCVFLHMVFYVAYKG